MTEYKTLRVPEDAYEAARESKHDDETWGEFLQRCTNNPPEIVEYVNASEVDGSTGGINVDELIDEIGATVGGPQVDDSEIARDVAAQIDYAELANQVANELEGRIR